MLTVLQVSPYPSPLPTSTFPCRLLPWPSLHYCPCPWRMHICSLANPFTFFFQSPSSSSPCLFHVSMLLSPFSLAVYLNFFSWNKYLYEELQISLSLQVTACLLRCKVEYGRGHVSMTVYLHL